MLFNGSLYRRLTAGEKLCILDGGARGELFDPFDKVPADLIHAIRIEPDPNAELTSSTTSIVHNKALWNTADGVVTLHVAKEPSTSSVYPPDKALLSAFEDDYGYPPRATQK